MFKTELIYKLEIYIYFGKSADNAGACITPVEADWYVGVGEFITASGLIEDCAAVIGWNVNVDVDGCGSSNTNVSVAILDDEGRSTCSSTGGIIDLTNNSSSVDGDDDVLPC